MALAFGGGMKKSAAASRTTAAIRVRSVMNDLTDQAWVALVIRFRQFRSESCCRSVSDQHPSRVAASKPGVTPWMNERDKSPYSSRKDPRARP